MSLPLPPRLRHAGLLSRTGPFTSTALVSTLCSFPLFHKFCHDVFYRFYGEPPEFARGASPPRLKRAPQTRTCNVITNPLCSYAGWPIRDDGRLVFGHCSQIFKSIHKMTLRSIPGESWVRTQGPLTKSSKGNLLQKARVSWLGIEPTTYPFQGQGAHRWATREG